MLYIFSFNKRPVKGSVNPAIEKTVEKLPTIMDSGNHEKMVQRTETKSMMRSHIPRTHGETHAHPMDEIPLVASDSSHERSGTW